MSLLKCAHPTRRQSVKKANAFLQHNSIVLVNPNVAHLLALTTDLPDLIAPMSPIIRLKLVEYKLCTTCPKNVLLVRSFLTPPSPTLDPAQQLRPILMMSTNRRMSILITSSNPSLTMFPLLPLTIPLWTHSPLPKSMANSAPGKDRVEYRHLKSTDPDCAVLTLIYNRCLLANRIPHHWKDATTILIHKKGPSDDPANFRPIALMSCLYKLFTSLLSSRMTDFAISHELLSPNQKSARPTEGCHEHTFTLQTIVADCERSKKNSFFAWLDVKNAFGSIPHDVIYATLEHMGFPAPLIRLIRDIYTDATTSVRTSKDESTEPITIKAGVKQGCPVSAILFNLASELLIRSVLTTAADHPEFPFVCHGQKISVLTYADDIVLVSRKREGLQAFLDARSRAANMLSLTFRPDKCASLSLTCGNAQSHVGDTVFHVQEVEIPVLQRNDSFRSGAPRGGVSQGNCPGARDYNPK